MRACEHVAVVVCAYRTCSCCGGSVAAVVEACDFGVGGTACWWETGLEQSFLLSRVTQSALRLLAFFRSGMLALRVVDCAHCAGSDGPTVV